MLAAEVHLKQGVVTALGAENCTKLFGVQGESDGIALSAIEDGGNLAGQAQPAGFILATFCAGVCFHNNFFLSHVTFLPSPDSYPVLRLNFCKTNFYPDCFYSNK